MLAILEQLIGPIVVRVVVALLDRYDTDEEFRAKIAPVRERLRAATTAEEARRASKQIHQLLRDG